MARLHVSADLIEELLFGATDNPVTVLAAQLSPGTRVFVFDIEGEDVPNVAEVDVKISERTNRAGDRLRVMTFEPIGDCSAVDPLKECDG